jgi:hypothetical protein
MNKIIVILGLLIIGCTSKNDKGPNPLKWFEKQNSIYARDVTGKDTFYLGDNFILKSTLTVPEFLHEARRNKHFGIAGTVFKNESKDELEFELVQSYIMEDTAYHEITVKSQNKGTVRFEYEIRLKVDVDDRNYNDLVDTTFIYHGYKIIWKP